MEKMNDLKDLLTHEVHDLYSAEEQIIEALPAMIEKASDPELKKALKEHLRVTEDQLKRLDEVKQLLKESGAQEGDDTGEKKGFLAGLFTTGAQVCRGMMGLIEEGQKIMREEMNPDVLDAAIIGAAQKIEHYEISGYGTARAFARELNLGKVAELLEETLDEEYEADDRLTDLAVGGLNQEAEDGDSRKKGKRKPTRRATGNGVKKAARGVAKRNAPAKKSAARAGKKTPAKKAPAKSGTRSKLSKRAGARTVKSPGGRAGTSHRGPRGR